MVDPMAAQMAQLLADSELEELREIVARWVMEAPTEKLKQHYQVFGNQMLKLKAELSVLPQPPRREDLEVALTMMLKLAAQRTE